MEIEKPAADEQARLFQEKINRQGRELAVARGQRDEALARIRVLENEVEELMRMDYWQERHKIAIRERDMALQGVANMNAEFVRSQKLVEACQELRIYCLGSDASTKNMIEKFDIALAEYSKGRAGA